MIPKLLVSWIVLVTAVLGYGQAAGPQRPSYNTAATAAVERAVLDQYCVTCHNDRTKRANLSLEKLDLSTHVTENPQFWEKVIRKLRAGVMPPPGMRRPDLPTYTGLAEWLETQIDRKAKLNPGTVVLHRMNRVEYANAIRDLLDIEIDPATLLPPDDSSRGLDNDAGSDGATGGGLEIAVPVKARTHSVGVTFLAANFRPRLDLAKHFARSTLVISRIAGFSNYPEVGLLKIQGPFAAQRPAASRSITKVFTCRPAAAAQEEPCAKQILSTIARRAYRRPANADALEALVGFSKGGPKGGTF